MTHELTEKQNKKLARLLNEACAHRMTVQRLSVAAFEKDREAHAYVQELFPDLKAEDRPKYELISDHIQDKVEIRLL